MGKWDAAHHTMGWAMEARRQRIQGDLGESQSRFQCRTRGSGTRCSVWEAGASKVEVRACWTELFLTSVSWRGLVTPALNSYKVFVIKLKTGSGTKALHQS